MPCLFWPNFDFEHELAVGDSWCPPEKLRQLNARFAPVFGALCGDDDLIVLPQSSSFAERTIGGLKVRFVPELVVRESTEFLGSDWTLMPWGVTTSLKRLAETRGWTWNHPDPKLVKTWNDRLTSVELERQGLPAGTVPQLIGSVDELISLLNARPEVTRWLVKARFGMSGRERLVGEGTKLSPPQVGWLKKRFVQQQTLIWEPWMEIVAEVGLQYHISQAGSVRFLAALPMLNSPTGEYLGSRLTLSPDDHSLWRPAITLGESLAHEAGETGYFGPFSIDAVRVRDRHEDHLRPVMDINARWTMGRLAYEWSQRVEAQNKTEWVIAKYFDS